MESFEGFYLLRCYSHSENRLLGVYFWHVLAFQGWSLSISSHIWPSLGSGLFQDLGHLRSQTDPFEASLHALMRKTPLDPSFSRGSPPKQLISHPPAAAPPGHCPTVNMWSTSYLQSPPVSSLSFPWTELAPFKYFRASPLELPPVNGTVSIVHHHMHLKNLWA